MKLSLKGLWKWCLAAFLVYLCIYYWEGVTAFALKALGAAWPLILGVIIAYLVNILMRVYEKHFFPRSQKPFVVKGRRVICMLAAFVSLAAVVTLVMVLVVPQFISCVQLIVSKVPAAMTALVDWLQKLDFLPQNLLSDLDNINWSQRLEQLVDVLSVGMGTVVKTVSSVFSGLVTALISLIFSIYILGSKETLRAQFDRLMRRYLGEKANGKLRRLLVLLDDCFSRYIVGQCTEAVILGGLCLGGMLLCGFPYAGMISALVAFTALIPVAGAYIGAFVGAFLILTVSPTEALGFLIFIVVLQQLEGNIIYPRVVGSSIGLPGLWVLAAVTIGGGVMGVAGMLLGVPLASAAYRLLREDVKKIEPMAAPCVAEAAADEGGEAAHGSEGV